MQTRVAGDVWWVGSNERLKFMAILALVLHRLATVAVVVSDEGTFTEISDLGNLLLGGFVLAVVVAVALTFVRLRMRDKKPPAPQFISINSSDSEE